MDRVERRWTEEDIEALPQEDNVLERKGSRLFDFSGGSSEGKLRDELAKQLSAFANSGGGTIILGVDNNGQIDGGISQVLRGRQSTKEWLEDIIPEITDPKIVGLRIFEIRPERADTKITLHHAVFVIEVPDSDQAPHQSARDHLYYIRLGSKSQPAQHRLIEDIRNRQRHPKLEVGCICIKHADYNDATGTEGYLQISLEIMIRNRGRVRASAVSVLLTTNTKRGLTCSGAISAEIRNGTKPGTALLDLNHGLYPGMEWIGTVTVVIRALYLDPVPTVRGALFTIDGMAPEDVSITVGLHADHAPLETSQFDLCAIDLNDELSKELSRVRSQWLIPHETVKPVRFGRRRRFR